MDTVKDIVRDASRGSRDNALVMAIELCQLLAKEGACANCCANNLIEIKKHLKAGDLTEDALERARHA